MRRVSDGDARRRAWLEALADDATRERLAELLRGKVTVTGPITAALADLVERTAEAPGETEGPR